MFSEILGKITARHVAITFGLITTILVVVLVIVAVDDSNTTTKLKETEQKLQVLELFIQSLIKDTTTVKPVVTTVPTTISG
ncbi:uncharacterized protein LOC105209210 [Zeugodacus cucurbitae]|uniref:uncharacterized protein LOC105209210 n=1 Tax=Zeugodacus cucurbitae TaxID=28588 RepID=UPI0005968208|nr:uncharacterized protein LOC105209210 [Zeugodacus cucurbitae]